jgi:monoamine oxidase
MTPPRTTTRRDFLRVAAAAAAAFSVTPLEAVELPTRLTRRGRAQRVVIVGAGLAGLVAGYELTRAGHDVIILEAQRRPGGRVYTLRAPFSDNLYAEAGAGRIPPWHNVTLQYVREFRLPLTRFAPTTRNFVWFLGGKRWSLPPGQSPPASELPYTLTADERRMGLDGVYDKYIHQPIRRLPRFSVEQTLPDAARALDDETIAESIRRQGGSEDAIRYLTSGFADDSALDFLRDGEGHDVPFLWKIIGGNDRLPHAFADRLRARIQYGAPVVRLAQDERGVSATVEQAGRRHEVRGDHLICTLPFPVLRDVEITPAFPEAKMDAIRTMEYGAVTRVYLQMRERYWRAQGNNGFVHNDLALEIWDPTHDLATQRGILMSYCYEDRARAVQAMAGEERIRWMLDLAETVHPGAREHFEGGTSWVWHEDPWQRGAYPVFRRGQLRRFAGHIATAEGRIHMAGDATSDYPGWMQGALLSGLRAAKEIQSA